MFRQKLNLNTGVSEVQELKI